MNTATTDALAALLADATARPTHDGIVRSIAMRTKAPSDTITARDAIGVLRAGRRLRAFRGDRFVEVVSVTLHPSPHGAWYEVALADGHTLVTYGAETFVAQRR